MALLNPKNTQKTVAMGKINSLWGIDKFHGDVIPKFSLKVDVAIVHVANVPLMHPHEPNDQVVVGDVVGISALWNWKL